MKLLKSSIMAGIMMGLVASSANANDDLNTYGFVCQQSQPLCAAMFDSAVDGMRMGIMMLTNRGRTFSDPNAKRTLCILDKYV